MFNLNFDIKTHTLENGLEVITIKKDTKIGSVNIGIKVGPMYENMQEKGISHFIEHTLFKGTKKRDNKTLNSELDFLGGEYNAYTDYDATVYTVSCLYEELNYACTLLSDMMMNSVFDEDEIEKERGVIISEILTNKDDIEDLSFKNVNFEAFENGFLKYDVTGIEENVKNFTRNDIISFYKKFYVPNNTVISIVSPLSHEESLKIIKNNFLKWQKKNIIFPKVNIENNKNTTVTNYKSNLEQSTITYLYTFNDLKKEEELPLKVLNYRLGESANSLLFREVREKNGYAYDIYTHLEITNRIKTLYIYTAVLNGKYKEVKKLIDNILEKLFLGKIQITKRDLEIMKKVHKTAVFTTLEDSSELCNYILHQKLDGADILEFINDMEKINTLDINSVTKVARKLLKNPTVHILMPKKSKGR
ncbi:pitrilysin family protein [Clostridium sp. BJN0001]|uniref:M16 family metallopeptidase n=1 Tax=Clostridium sp. BJN0001 TaxID=2930219 RepID=UPI001FD4F7EC|nr:pitrilysin family protein [Clostridium sp. BJN0001]